MTNVYKPIFILFSVSFLVSILFQVSFGEEKGQSLDMNFPCNRNNLEITPFKGNATANEGFKPGFEKPKEENGNYIFNIDGYAYLSSATIWRDTSGQISKRIYVCWENPSEQDSQEREWVKDAVTQAWSINSALAFAGWDKCASANHGIRIQIKDSGPHTKGLGSYLDNKPNGMVLNFTFNNWSATCRASLTQRKSCITSIAVHEFGHALGFAHEHNRPDTPGECTESPQGSNGDVMLTPYDPSSVMNYCNPRYNNYGQLSKYDLAALQCVYGRP